MKFLTILFSILVITGCTGVKDGGEKQTQEESIKKLTVKAEEAFSFCQKNDFNTDFCILIDLKIHSGRNRMFVWNFKNKDIDRAALCAHGVGKDDQKSTPLEPLFSNVDGSLLSSLGKYKLGIRSYSKWGINIHYKMHGLEETNSNAFSRYIVLHSYAPVEDHQTYPEHMRLGWSQGCPVTSNEMMTYLDERLQKAEKPVLLWIYY